MADANNKLNTILKQLKDWKVSDISNWDKENGEYNTNYDIVDKDYNIILSNRRQSCFSEFFCSHYNDEKIGFKQDGRKMLIYALSQDVSNTEEEILFFISNIKSLGYSFNFKILEEYDLNSKSLTYELDYPNNENSDGSDDDDCYCYDDDCDCYNNGYSYRNGSVPCFENQKVYMMEIPFDKHKDLTTVKILAYFFRSLYEYDHYQMISWFMEYKKRFPQYSIISIWPLFEHKMRMCGLRNHHLGHSLFYNPCKITLSEFKKIVDHEQKTNVYDNRNLENIMRSIPYPSISYNGRWGSSIAKLSKTLDLNESITDYFKKAENIQDLKTINEIYEGGDNKENVKLIYLYGWYGGQQPYERQY